MEGLLEEIEDSGISVVDENGEPDPRAIGAARRLLRRNFLMFLRPLVLRSMIRLECTSKRLAGYHF